MRRKAMTLPTVFFITVFLAMVLFGSEGRTQDLYPKRPITVVNPWGAGGMLDSILRVYLKSIEKELGQPVIMEYKTGGGGAIAMNYVLKSNPDGYTVGACGIASYVIVPHMRKVPYDPFADSVDVATFFKYIFGVATKADSPWKTFKDVITYAKNNPGKMTYSCAGVGLPQHICMEQLAMEAGIKWTMIPFKSGSEAVTACLGGHTDLVAQGPVDILPHVKAGTLRFLLSLDDKRWASIPDVPNTFELGFHYSTLSFIFFVTPKGVPEPIIEKLANVFNKGKKDPSFIEMTKKFGLEVMTMDRKEFTNTWKTKWYVEMGKIIPKLGLQE